MTPMKTRVLTWALVPMACGVALDGDQLEGRFAVSATPVSYSCRTPNPVSDSDTWTIEHHPGMPTMGTAQSYRVQSPRFTGSFVAGSQPPSAISGRFATATADVMVEARVERWGADGFSGVFKVSEGNCVPTESAACLAVKTQPDCGALSFVARRQ
jgi:hypothetical protein